MLNCPTNLLPPTHGGTFSSPCLLYAQPSPSLSLRKWYYCKLPPYLMNTILHALSSYYGLALTVHWTLYPKKVLSSFDPASAVGSHDSSAYVHNPALPFLLPFCLPYSDSSPLGTSHRPGSQPTSLPSISRVQKQILSIIAERYAHSPLNCLACV